MNRVRATVAAEIILHDLRPRSIERLRFALSYPHPDRVKAIRRKADPAGIPLRYECITERPDGSVAVPRGAVDAVRAALAEDDLGVDFEDQRALGEPIGPLPTPASTEPLTPYAYQSTGVARLLAKTQGMIVLPTGGGKTKTAAWAIVRIARTTLVIVPTGDLADQWAEEVRTSVGVEPGIVDADRKDIDRSIVIASPLSLAPMLEADPSLGERFGLVIIDESHGVAAQTQQRCLRLLPARYRLGLTATPDREDGHGKLVDWSFGPRLIVKTLQELVAEGFLMMPRFVMVPTAFEHEVDPDDRRALTKLHRALECDADRNALIAELAMWEVQAGETVLLLANRKGLCRRLGKLLAKMGVDARVVVSTTKKSDRKGDLEALRSGEAPIVIATSLADQGLNVKRLSRLILAFPETARGRTVQRVGRLTRKWEGKDPVVYDVVDPRVPTLANRAAARRRSYRSIGMDV